MKENPKHDKCVQCKRNFFFLRLKSLTIEWFRFYSLLTQIELCVLNAQAAPVFEIEILRSAVSFSV